MAGSCERATNFHDELFNKGCRLDATFGNSTENQDLAGGYLYNNQLGFIIRNCGDSMEIVFPDIGLEKENKVAYAVARKVGSTTWLFVHAKRGYIPVKLVAGKKHCEVWVVRNAMSNHVEDQRLSKWLQQNPSERFYAHKVIKNDSLLFTRRLSVYYEFRCERVTVERIYAVRDSLRTEAKKELFKDIFTIEGYEKYAGKYPNDPLLSIIEDNIINNCNTIRCVERFIARFPESRHIELALQKLKTLQYEKAKNDAYRRAMETKTIADMDRFITEFPEGSHADSVYAVLIEKAGDISREVVERKWNEGKQNQAFRYLTIKSKYGTVEDMEWCAQKLAEYAWKSGELEKLNQAEELLEHITMGKNGDARLTANTYMAFVNWYKGNIEDAIRMVDSKKGEVYVAPKVLLYRKRLKADYNTVKSWKINFPQERSTWKAMRKK